MKGKRDQNDFLHVDKRRSFLQVHTILYSGLWPGIPKVSEATCF